MTGVAGIAAQAVDEIQRASNSNNLFIPCIPLKTEQKLGLIFC